MTMSCTWSNQSWYHPGCPGDREIIMLCTWSIQSHLDRESQTQSNKRVDFFFMTMSCTWSNQSWHCPSAPDDRETLPIICMDTIMSCAWSNQSHSD